MSHLAGRLAAALSDRYRLERKLGEGGMAEVFLARDLKHDRDVALKVLRPELGAAVGHERFFLEIKTLAALSHPHILPLHDSGDADGLLYYVMPFVDGETLLERMAREGPLPVDEALRLAAEVAEALAYAHEEGIIHRDIKPANIMLQRGHALVADFGIAAAVDVAGGERLTRTGIAVGTPAYMSPEQSSAAATLDGRSDVYALACVLYELLAGTPPFDASTPQAMIARHAVDPVPSLRTVREAVPPGTERVLMKALAKVPADRFATAAEFAAALRSPGAGVAYAARGGLRQAAPYVAGAIAVAAVLGWAITNGDRAGGEPANAFVGGTRRPLTSYQGWEMGPSWSPDGSSIAYSHIVNGSGEVAVLSLGGGEPNIITDHPADDVNPRWSPDGSRLAFVSDRGTGSDIYLIPPTGGVERKLVETNIPAIQLPQDWFMLIGAVPWSPDGRQLVFSRLDEDSGAISLWKVDLDTRAQTQLTQAGPGGADVTASWSHDGSRIVFARRQGIGYTLWQVSGEGGEAEPLFTDSPFSGWPAWSRDDEHVLFISMIEGPQNIWDLDVSTGALSPVTAGSIGNDAQPVVAPDGTIAYANWDHEIDVYELTPEGDESDVRLTSFTGSNFGARVSPDGSEVLFFSNRAGLYALWRVDRQTGEAQQLNDKPSNDKLGDWSPDGSQVVFVSDRNGEVGLWVLDIETGVERRLTDQILAMTMFPAEGGGPRWSPDGDVIGYLAPHEGVNTIWTVRPDGTDARPLPVANVLSFSWYRDSRRVVYVRVTGEEGASVELRARHLDAGEDVHLLSGALGEVEVSPRGDRLSFVESASHFTMELHVLDLVPPTDADGLPRAAGEARPVTFGGGVWHAHNGGWSPDGRTLVYSRDRDYGDVHLLVPRR